MNESPSPTPATPAEEFTIMSTGDILLHLSVTHAARTDDDSYDYQPMFEYVKPFIEQADVALCALEVPIVAPGEEPSSYPLFGAPWDLADSLARIGFDGCATATNHTADRGFAGIESTIEALDGAGLGWVGSGRTAAESEETQFYTIHGEHRDLTVAHISASTLTNGISIPAEHPYSWNVVGSLGEPVDTVIDEAREAREVHGADVVVVSIHWGTEYVSQPIEEQTEIAQYLADSGQVDLIFGNRSHTPQPVISLDGGPQGEGMWVA